MNIIHVLKTDGGGAGRAAVRLHQGLQKIDEHSSMLVDFKKTDASGISELDSMTQKFQRRVAKRLNLRKLGKFPALGTKIWSPLARWRTTVREISRLNPDLINLHWLGMGFLPLAALSRIDCPVVWTFHDMWTFTGGCHYNEGCEKYKTICGNCPQLGSGKENDLSRQVFNQKQKAIQNLNLTIVTPSQWLADCAKASTILRNHRVEVIPYGLDLDLFKPMDKVAARTQLGVPTDKQVVLFGALNSVNNLRKGFDLLKEAIEKLSNDNNSDQLYLLILGSNEPYESLGLPLPGSCLGEIRSDVEMARAYSAADVFVAPSRQDNLPNTVLEATACGTATVAFQIGGMPDMITHLKTGYLAEPFSAADLAQGIARVTNRRDNEFSVAEIRNFATTNFPLIKQASRYKQLYEELISADRKAK